MRNSRQLWLVPLFAISVTFTAGARVQQIRYLTWNGGGTEGEARRKAIAAFEAKHPDIKVKIVLGASTNYFSRYLQMNVQGTAPDVAEIDSQDAWKLVDNHLVEDLNRFQAEERALAENMIREYLSLFTYKGTLSAIPLSYSVSCLAYNYGMFLDAAIPFPTYFSKTGNWGWDNFLSAAKKLTRDKNGDGKIDTWGYGQNAGWSWDFWVYGNGGSMVNSEATKCTLDGNEAIDALQFQSDLVRRYKVAPTTGFFVDDFASSKIGMCQGTPGIYAQWKAKGNSLKWDIAPFPYEKRPYTPMLANGLVISKQSRRKKEAWEFIKFMSGSEAQKLLIPGLQGGIPANLTVAKSEAFLGQKPPESLDVSVYEALKADAQRNAWGLPLPPLFRSTLDLEVGWLWTKGETASQVVNRVVPVLNKMLDDWYRQRKSKKR